jgi:hypothetical protein
MTVTNTFKPYSTITRSHYQLSKHSKQTHDLNSIYCWIMKVHYINIALQAQDVEVYAVGKW